MCVTTQVCIGDMHFMMCVYTFAHVTSYIHIILYYIIYIIPQLGFALGVLTYWWKGLDQMFAKPPRSPVPRARRILSDKNHSSWLNRYLKKLQKGPCFSSEKFRHPPLHSFFLERFLLFCCRGGSRRYNEKSFNIREARGGTMKKVKLGRLAEVVWKNVLRLRRAEVVCDKLSSESLLAFL